MEPATLIRAMQVLVGLCWALPVALHSASVWRVMTGHAEGDDARWMIACFMGANQVGFSLRWLAYGSTVPLMGSAEIALWAGLYVMSAMVALGTFAVISLLGKAGGGPA